MTHKVYIPDATYDKIAAAHERVNGPPKTDGELLDECAAEIDAGAERADADVATIRKMVEDRKAVDEYMKGAQ